MSELVFSCPSIGRKVPTGIETDAATARQLPTTPITLRCPLCGEEHHLEQGRRGDSRCDFGALKQQAQRKDWRRR
jgi:hypothetical protein